MEHNTILIDLEFTGLDNTFISDNEITQVKLMNVETGKRLCRNFKASKKPSVYDIIYNYERFRYSFGYIGDTVFSQEEFIKMLNELGLDIGLIEGTMFHDFWGYSVGQDLNMLQKYHIGTHIKDMQDKMRLCDEYEKKLATGCAKMECAYYLLTGKIPPLDTHSDERELDLLAEMYQKVKELKTNKFLKLMPWGHCAGMPLTSYISEYHRAADGYRFHNHDILAESMNELMVDDEFEEEFEEE